MIEIRVGQLAEKLGVHRNTVTNWIRSGKLRASGHRREEIPDREGRIARSSAAEQGIPAAILQEVVLSNGGSIHRVMAPITPTLHSKTKEVTMSGKAHRIGTGGRRRHRRHAGDASIWPTRVTYVHLVEKSAGIGGVMSQLDKTFPTNDCAM
ncbi:MAG: helix-turn-helix domain-containing protein [Desulfobacterales bacterium]|nr:helix-turn-helix domain-containing protein [Desulfobacterales bacterium]